MNRIGRAMGFGAAIIAAGGAFAGCGGDDEVEKHGSFSSIVSAIESPTGKVDASSAPEVGKQFEKVSQISPAGGTRRDAQAAQSSASGTQSCPEGGSFSVHSSGSQSSGSAAIAYDHCCFIEDCCFDGDGDMYFSNEQGSDFAYCASYNLDYSCQGTTAAIDFDGCFGATGQLVYVVEVGGETYSVSGNYSAGSGTLEVHGANGTWNCTYSNGGGSCTGTSGNFSF